jgi:hypothetical protein
MHYLPHRYKLTRTRPVVTMSKSHPYKTSLYLIAKRGIRIKVARPRRAAWVTNRTKNRKRVAI